MAWFNRPEGFAVKSFDSFVPQKPRTEMPAFGPGEYDEARDGISRTFTTIPPEIDNWMECDCAHQLPCDEHPGLNDN
jgi:hypothetical protein